MNQISQNRAFIATERFTQKPIKLHVARPNHLGYAIAKIADAIRHFAGK